MKKKFLLTLMLITLTIVAFSTISVSAETEGIYTYTVSNGKATITKCNSSASGEILIPNSLGGYQVIGIGDNAFYKCENITGVTISKGVTSIGDEAFMYCYDITYISIPDSVITIGDNAFFNCIRLKSISIPASVTTIGNSAFDACQYMESIEVSLDNQNFSSEEGVFFDKNKTVLIKYPQAKKDTSYVMPDGVIKIANSAFYSCENLTDVKISNSVTSIGDYAFYSSGLKVVTIGENVTTIGNSAFMYSGLTSITIPDSVVEIGEYAFFNSSLKNVNFGAGLKKIGGNAFYACYGLTSIEIPDSVTDIGSQAFYSCGNLTSVSLGKNLENIGEKVFLECNKLATITVSDLNEKYASIDNVLYNKNQTNLILYVSSKKDDVFIIPDSVITISNYAFYNSANLKEITIGINVQTIYSNAFNGCSQLSDVHYNASRENFDKINIYSGNNALTYANKHFLFIAEGKISNDIYYYIDSQYTLFVRGTGEMPDYSDEWSWYKYSVRNVVIEDGITRIGDRAFIRDSIGNITISKTVKEIGEFAFWYTSVGEIYYNGTEEEFLNISIEYGNPVLSEKKKNYFYYLTILDEKNNELFNGTVAEKSLVDLSMVEEKEGHSIHAYYDMNYSEEYNLELPITQNLNLYLKYVPNKYISKFVNDDGTLIKEILVDYGSVITPPNNPTKPATQQYYYTFDSWEGYTEGMMQENREMVFKATYTATVNQYTYKFVDEDETILKEGTVDYGTTIIPPEINDKTEYYLFDYWQGYTENMTLTEDVTFKAIFKYKNYSINADGLSEPVIVTYNSGFAIEPQKLDDYHYFIGYFTEKNGKGIQITNEKGESLSIYNVVGDLTVYPHFYEGYMNKVELQSVETAMPGDTITQRTIFATDKNSTYFIATVKYPKHLNFRSIKGVDFKEATKDSERVVGDYKYLDITCVFDYEGNFAEINKNYVPFEIEFDVATDAPVGACDISIENVMLIGDDTFEITDIKNHTLTILPKLAESIEIIGSAEIDKATQFTTVVSPDYTTDKSVVWSVNDETVATITQDGTVTPVKNGTVIITATAKDGSEVFATKAVNVIAYAKINSLDFGSGVVLTEFNPDVRKYTIYVKEDTTSISLTPTFSGGGVLRPNGSGVWVSGRAKDFELNDVETTITLNRENVTDMTNSVYTIEVIKFEGTKTKVSEDKKSFTITPINVENGKTVILALYNGEQFVEMQSAIYTGEEIPFTTTKTYTKAKVMVWDVITNLKPVCGVEEIN